MLPGEHVRAVEPDAGAESAGLRGLAALTAYYLRLSVTWGSLTRPPHGVRSNRRRVDARLLCPRAPLLLVRSGLCGSLTGVLRIRLPPGRQAVWGRGVRLVRCRAPAVVASSPRRSALKEHAGIEGVPLPLGNRAPGGIVASTSRREPAQGLRRGGLPHGRSAHHCRPPSSAQASSSPRALRVAGHPGRARHPPAKAPLRRALARWPSGGQLATPRDLPDGRERDERLHPRR
jgi:hypothetical protein